VKASAAGYNAYRQRVEGKFGIGKRKYAWDCVREKLAETSKTKIHLVSLVMNIDKILRDLIFALIEIRAETKAA
jgi:hypothetical protein